MEGNSERDACGLGGITVVHNTFTVLTSLENSPLCFDDNMFA